MQQKIDAPLGVKQLKDNGYFSGYASVFDVADNDRDVMEQGAFAASLANHKPVKLLWQHDMSEPIGTIHTLREDARGLYIEGKLLLDVQRAREAHSLLKEGALEGLSIGYRVKEYSLNPDTGMRHLHEVELMEVSLVTFPANEEATVVQVKGDVQHNIRDFEKFLREAGFSRKQATHIALHGFKAGADESRYLASALDYAREVLEVKDRTSLWAPPLVWGPWTNIGLAYGLYNQDVTYTISFDSQSQAPSSFDIEIRGFAGHGRSDYAVGPGNINLVMPANNQADILVRAKSHSLGQHVIVTM